MRKLFNIDFLSTAIYLPFLTGILFVATSCKSPTGTEVSSTQIRIVNLSGYDFSEVDAKFFVDTNSVVLSYQDLVDGSATEYQEVEEDIFSDDGDYCTYTNVFSDSLGFWLNMGILCTGLNQDRAVPITRGKYSFILEYIPSEFLSLELNTHKKYEEDSSAVLIQIQNDSEQDFLKVIAKFPGDSKTDPQEIDFGPVYGGQNSEYVDVELAYRYTYVMAITREDTLEWMPIDYVGETPLSAGEYAYALDIVIGPKDVSRIVKE